MLAQKAVEMLSVPFNQIQLRLHGTRNIRQALETPKKWSTTLQPVRVIAFANRQFGLGVSARRYLDALKQFGVRVEYFEPGIELPHGGVLEQIENSKTSERADVTLFFTGPEQLESVLALIPPKREEEIWIGCWFWELEKVPQNWLGPIAKMDALIASTTFIQEAFSKVTLKPVFKVPVPLFAPQIRRPEESSPYRFITMFDFHSGMARKNPLGVVEAFRKAFPDGNEDVELIVKTSNASDFPSEFNRLATACSKDKRIRVMSGVLAFAEHIRLLESSDAFVSLHRSEGFGMAMAEAMALGIPVIATGWSGNMEFMDSGTAMLTEYTLRKVLTGEYPHSEGCRWAEPDIDNAAKLMCSLHADLESAKSMAERAHTRICEQLNPNGVASDICSHIEKLMANHCRGTPTTTTLAVPTTYND